MHFESSKEHLQRVCAGFLACKEQFLAKVPSDFAKEQMKEIEKTLRGKYVW